MNTKVVVIIALMFSFQSVWAGNNGKKPPSEPNYTIPVVKDANGTIVGVYIEPILGGEYVMLMNNYGYRFGVENRYDYVALKPNTFFYTESSCTDTSNLYSKSNTAPANPIFAPSIWSPYYPVPGYVFNALQKTLGTGQVDEPGFYFNGVVN